MNKMWSTYVQTSEELYNSRSVRFREDNKKMWIESIKVENEMNVLEVGCGSGLLSHRIKEFLPNCKVTGIDRDSGHISFAQNKTIERELDCKFVLGDALSIPFENDVFDFCVSHTVIEHVETSGFLKEQYRVLKPDGIIAVLSVRTGMSVYSDECKSNTEEDILMKKLWKNAGDFDEENGIGKYEMRECDFPKALNDAGFKDINVDFIAISRYMPDNSSVDSKLAIKQIEVNRLHTLESVKKALNIEANAISNEEVDRLYELINDRYNTRITKYNSGEKLWDMGVSVVMVTTGVK